MRGWLILFTALLLCLEVLPQLNGRRNEKLETQASSPRDRRQSKPRRVNIFRLIGQIIAETANDTSYAFSQISDLVSENIIPVTSDDKKDQRGNTTTTPAPTGGSSTTEVYRITQDEVLSILSRNLRGLVNLFNKEYRDALNQSNKNSAQFRKDLRESLRPFLTPAN